eukprot:GHVN01060345.1.p1 GENE.GHVN01060345.1~~GHVN01060345.1.p1  ORF type:complete len:701 (+),score=127.04 GHVN01060345.1:87-2189(+)
MSHPVPPLDMAAIHQQQPPLQPSNLFPGTSTKGVSQQSVDGGLVSVSVTPWSMGGPNPMLIRPPSSASQKPSFQDDHSRTATSCVTAASLPHLAPHSSFFESRSIAAQPGSGNQSMAHTRVQTQASLQGSAVWPHQSSNQLCQQPTQGAPQHAPQYPQYQQPQEPVLNVPPPQHQFSYPYHHLQQGYNSDQQAPPPPLTYQQTANSFQQGQPPAPFPLSFIVANQPPTTIDSTVVAFPYPEVTSSVAAESPAVFFVPQEEALSRYQFTPNQQCYPPQPHPHQYPPQHKQSTIQQRDPRLESNLVRPPEQAALLTPPLDETRTVNAFRVEPHAFEINAPLDQACGDERLALLKVGENRPPPGQQKYFETLPADPYPPKDEEEESVKAKEREEKEAAELKVQKEREAAELKKTAAGRRQSRLQSKKAPPLSPKTEKPFKPYNDRWFDRGNVEVSEDEEEDDCFSPVAQSIHRDDVVTPSAQQQSKRSIYTVGARTRASTQPPVRRAPGLGDAPCFFESRLIEYPTKPGELYLGINQTVKLPPRGPSTEKVKKKIEETFIPPPVPLGEVFRSDHWFITHEKPKPFHACEMGAVCINDPLAKVKHTDFMSTSPVYLTKWGVSDRVNDVDDLQPPFPDVPGVPLDKKGRIRVSKLKKMPNVWWLLMDPEDAFDPDSAEAKEFRRAHGKAEVIGGEELLLANQYVR